MFNLMNDLMELWAKPATTRVLRALADRTEFASIRDLARLAAVSVGTAHRVVGELTARDAVDVRAVRHRKLVRLRRQVPTHLLPPPLETAATDLSRLRRSRVPVQVVSGRDLTRLGWPMRLREIVLLPRSWASRIHLEQPVVPFHRERPLQWRTLRPEDVAIAMLEINPIAARALFERAGLDRRRFRRRIVEEEKLDQAATVGLTERLRLPTPRGIERIPEEQIQRQLRQNPQRAVRA